MLRIIKILLVLSIALWALIGVVGNLIDWAGTTGAVEAATSMSTFDPAPTSGRAITNGAVTLLGALFIVLLKALTAAMCLFGAWQMWGARASDAVDFAQAKTWALTGCGVTLFMLFVGWIVIAETWFEMWRSPLMTDLALNAAFRYAGMIGVMALFVGAREE